MALRSRLLLAAAAVLPLTLTAGCSGGTGNAAIPLAAPASPGDATYTRIENALQRLGAARDALGARMNALLLGAAFDGRPLDVQAARALIRRGDRLLGQAAVLGAGSA